MKKIILSITLMCFAAGFTASAQSFLTSSGSTDTVSMGYEPGDMFVHNNLKSNTGSAITLSWRVSGIDTSGGWHFGGFCDNFNCYSVSGGVLTNSYSPTYGTSFADFHAVFNGDDAEMGSSASITVRVSDPATSYTRNLTFIAYKSPTGITTTQAGESAVSLWPNPARGAVNVQFNPASGVRYAAIYNMIGKVVTNYRVQGNSAKLDIDNLPPGVYMLRLLNGQGRVVATKRFTHQ